MASEKTSVLIVSGMIGGLLASASTVSGAQRKRQFSSVNGPAGRSPSIRVKKEEKASQKYNSRIGRVKRRRTTYGSALDRPRLSAPAAGGPAEAGGSGWRAC